MSTLLLDGHAVWPRRALEGGYRFRYATLRQALPALAAASMGRAAPASVGQAASAVGTQVGSNR